MLVLSDAIITTAAKENLLFQVTPQLSLITLERGRCQVKSGGTLKEVVDKEERLEKMPLS